MAWRYSHQILTPSLKSLTFSTERRSYQRHDLLSLPSVHPEAVGSTIKLPKLSSKTIKSLAMGELEARKIKSSNTGTEAQKLFFWELDRGQVSFASKFLRANGITLLKVRDEFGKLRGNLDMFFFSPEHPPLTEATSIGLLMKSIDQSLVWIFPYCILGRFQVYNVCEQNSGENGGITTGHVLVGLWRQEEPLGHQVLVSLGFTDEKAKGLHSLITEPGYKDD